MLTATQLTKAAGGKKLVDGVSARFEAGKLNLIMGPNGAGQSTLLKLLSRQLRPDAGLIESGKTDITTLSSPELARVRATLSQNVEIAFPLRVWEVVLMG